MSGQAGVIYKNVLAMLKYRDSVLTSEVLDETTFSSQLNHYEYVLVSATRAASETRTAANAVFVIIAPGSKYASRTQDFRILLKKIIPASTSTRAAEVMFITHEPITNRLEKFLDDHRMKFPNVFVETCRYYNFVCEVPLRVDNPPHKIMTNAEVNEVLNRHKKEKSDVQFIQPDDAMSIWLGIRLGQWVQVERVSETAGIAIGYRVCVRPIQAKLVEKEIAAGQ